MKLIRLAALVLAVFAVTLVAAATVDVASAVESMREIVHIQ